ncbi:hypothetical protein QQP08_012547 [Theobroma cacao]|uniref:Transmembrane protein n=1 Tax=Theobroma cacao TaxID=3641 RepID=A0A061EPR7_THECC|nr:Uncharacterized protein TCM_019583 [Theobroma cacao]WRX20060.1 hypothetical protein QQP08_012547 [Theobroma cacao]
MKALLLVVILSASILFLPLWVEGSPPDFVHRKRQPPPPPECRKANWGGSCHPPRPPGFSKGGPYGRDETPTN